MRIETSLSSRKCLDCQEDWLLETRKGNGDDKRRPGGEQRKREETAKVETKAMDKER
jgi:hypothetical protein